MWECRHDKDEPYIPIAMNGEQVDANREDFHLYTFAPEYAEVDHVYLTRQEQERRVGAYVFRMVVPDFDDLVKVMQDNHFWHIHGPKPSDADLEVYAKSLSKDIDETPEWLK